MNIREAARQAIAENMDVDNDVRDCIEEIILRASALAGYGWRDIAQAKKDGTMYFLWNEKDKQLGCFLPESEKEQWGYFDLDKQIIDYMDPQPTMFHELPPPPTKQENIE